MSTGDVEEFTINPAKVRMWKRHPVYKDSGVEWLGEVPAGWEVRPLKRRFRIVNGGTPASSEALYWDGNITWFTPEDLGKNETKQIANSGRHITKEGLDNCSAQLVPRSPIIISTRAPIGHIAIADVEACTNQGCRSLGSLGKGVSVDFYYYVLFCSKAVLQAKGKGTTFMELSTGDLGSHDVPVPSTAEQQTIAAFLDREITRIDALIEKKRRFIELLEEKRQALISHAVTKGLDPNAEMKDSGVEWLGEVPVHWKIIRAKHLFRELNERSKNGDEELLTVSHITGVTPRSEKDVNMFMAESLEGYKKCYPSDLVINTMWAWMGALGTAKNEGIVSPSYNVYRSIRYDYDPTYYDNLFRIPNFKAEIIRYSKGIWSSRWRLYPNEFSQMLLPVPPLNEQKQIAKSIETEGAIVDTFVQKNNQQIEKLQEYRTALISAAVTGKIDVRSEVGVETA